jgi:hypothetical protein
VTLSVGLETRHRQPIACSVVVAATTATQALIIASRHNLGEMHKLVQMLHLGVIRDRILAPRPDIMDSSRAFLTLRMEEIRATSSMRRATRLPMWVKVLRVLLMRQTNTGISRRQAQVAMLKQVPVR